MLEYNEDQEVQKEPTEKRNSRSDIESIRIVGPEPTWVDTLSTDPDFDSKYGHALNWANYSLEDEDFRQQTLIYLKDKNKDIEFVEEAKTWRFNTIGKICWTINNGCPVKPSTKQFLNKGLLELEAGAKLDHKEVEPEEKVKKLKKSEIKEILYKDRLDNTIAHIDSEIDEMIITEVEVDVYSLLLNLDVETSIAKEIKEHYKTEINKLSNEHSNVEKDTDLSPEEIKQYQSDLTKHLDALRHTQHQIDSYLGNNKAKRNTNKIRSKITLTKNVKSVKNVKFLTHDNKLKVQSIPLDRIIGTQMLITYNVKNRKLSLYYAQDESGLQVKGTTILNYDEVKSLQKTLRQPEKILSHLQQNSDLRARIVFKDLSTRSVMPNGRLNEHTILLKAFKIVTVRS